jgi:hypothetical protein
MEPLFKDKMEVDKYKFTKKNAEQKCVHYAQFKK